MFQEALLFQKAIELCYNSQIVVRVFVWIPPIITWHICQRIVTTCVLNQSKDHQLLSDVLNNAIIMSSKLKEDVGIVQNLNQFMDDDLQLLLNCLCLFLTLRKKFVVSLILFFHL